MKTMRQLGFRDVFMEAIIMEEVEKMSERLKANFDRKVVNMDDIFMNHLLNIIWGVSTGVQLSLMFCSGLLHRTVKFNFR